MELPDLWLNAFEVPEGFGTFAGVPEESGGVVNGCHPDAPLFHPLPMLPGDAKVGANEA